MKINTRGFYAGIDSGGTKCEILITDLNKKVIYRHSFKGIHYSVAGVRDYCDTVSEYIVTAFKKCKISLKECKAIGIGIAGARESTDRIKLKKAFEKKLEIKNFFVYTDAMTALYGAFEGEEGIILISGTGSVLYGFANGKVTRVGGWGRIIGDEGGGYWIGKRALNLLTQEFDKGNESKILLAKNIKKEFGIDRSNVNEEIFHRNFDIQKIAPLVIKSAEKKCKISLQIVNEAAQFLTDHVKTFLKITGLKRKIKIAFIGSIIENENIMSDNLKKELMKLKNIEIVKKKHQPSFGAVLLAEENSIKFR